MIEFTSLMRIPQTVETFGAEKVLAPRRWREKQFAGQFLQLVPKPVIQRNRESHLPTSKDFRRQELAERLSEQSFSTSTTILQRGRQRRSKLDDVIIQKRCTAFQS